MIKKSQIKEVLLKYIVPLQKQYPDFYLGGSLALILQKHIPARDVKDLDIISPVSFGDLHETKFPYKGMVTSKKTYHIREIKTCLDFFHNPKAKYVTANIQGHIIKLSPIDEIVHAKENKIWSPVYKNKQENLKQVIKEIFSEIKVQPKNTGVSSKIKKLGITLGKYNLSGDEIGSKYPWVYAQEKLSSTTKKNAEYFFNKLNITPTKIFIGLVYRGELPDEELNTLSDVEKINRSHAKSFYIEGNYKGTPIIIARKETRSPMAGQTYLVSPYAKLKFNHIKDLPANEILAALKIPNEGNVDEIKTQPVNRLIKPTKKKTITDEPYIDIDTSFIEDYILDYGEISYDTIQFFNFINVKANENTIRDAEYINHILNGDYKLYFNEDKKEIDYILTLNDPLNIKDYARDRAEMLSDNPEDIDFLAEEIMLAIETIQDNIPKYIAAKKILKDKFTIISNDEFSVILTSDSNGHSFLYTMIEKQDGYFNKNGEIVIYTT
jgi:hypothetical protein